MKRVMIHSGGGCMGYIPLQTLVQYEKEYGSLYNYFDLMAGSSVGAINAAILATGKMSAKELNAIYPEMIKRVFKKRNIFQRIFVDSTYDRQNFVEVWDELIGKDFKMKDCKTKLQITAISLLTQRNHFFKSWEEKDGQELLVDVVMRSFAAPIYFGKLVDEKNKNVWIDGGCGNSNLPLDNAYVEAIDILDWNSDPVIFEAFGCGYSDETITFEKAKKYKSIRTGLSYFDLGDGGLARAQSKAEQVQLMLIKANNNKNIGFKYWDICLPKSINKLDGVEYLNEYKIYGVKMTEKPLIDISPRK